MNIIGIMGVKRSGKDTVSDYFVQNLGFIQYAFGDPLKIALQSLFMFTDKQLWGEEIDKEAVDERWGISPRRMMEIVGTDLFQFDIHKHLREGELPVGRGLWVNRFNFWREDLLNINPSAKIIVSDIRFEHEANRVKELGGQIWKVIRPSIKSVSTAKAETELEKIRPDKILINDSTKEDLYNKIKQNL